MTYCQNPFLKSHSAQARSQGGGGSGGSYDPPPVAHPKDFVPPFSNFVPPFSNFVPPPSAILFHPSAILFHPSAILFHPLAILFHPWNMWMTSRGQCQRGGACECPRVGRFSNWWRHADNVQGGGVLVNVQEWGRFSNWWRHADNVQGGVRLVFHPSKFRPPPPPPGWLATGLVHVHVQNCHLHTSPRYSSLSSSPNVCALLPSTPLGNPRNRPQWRQWNP